MAVIHDGKEALLTWEQAVALTGKLLHRYQWETELETYHLWLEKTPCGEFLTVIEGAWGIYQIASAGHEPVGYFLNPLQAETYASAHYGAAWQDTGRQLIPYEVFQPISD